MNTQPKNAPPQQQLSLDAVVNNAFKMTTGLNNFISSMQESFKTFDSKLAESLEENKQIPKLKAEILELKGTIKILKKKK